MNKVTMMKTMKRHSFMKRLKSLAFVFGIAMAFASCANDDLAQKGTTPNDDKELTTFSTGDPATRTSMSETGTFYWEAGDKIYVKDDNGDWHASSNAPTGKTASFKFKVPGKYTDHNSYDVYYPGKNGSNDQVAISATQTQTTPNTTTHFGVSGDCGMAEASRVGTNQQFSFVLNHKAAYLRFLPRTENVTLQDCYLTKVEVTSDDDIAATYTLDKTTGKLIGTGTGKEIILTTQGSGSYANGFPLTNNATSAATNGAYMVIKPGTHNLKISYWVKDVATNVEGKVTKVLISKTFDQNKYYDITANLFGSEPVYTKWDAQKPFWYQHEWNASNPADRWQPTINGTSSTNFSSMTDPQIQENKTVVAKNARYDAVNTCKDCPNANELVWYAQEGAPHWDADEVWVALGHLHKGGMWFKKKATMASDHGKSITDIENFAPDGTDFRIRVQQNLINSNVTSSPLSASEVGDYFFLPAFGGYDSNDNGKLILGNGSYWSSSAVGETNSGDNNHCYSFYFTSNMIGIVSSTGRGSGAVIARKFE